jgi:hypothetical protein
VNSATARIKAGRDRELELIRTICRAVIRRVRLESPLLQGAELFVRLHGATPFPVADPILQAIWDDEVMSAVRESADDGLMLVQ